MCRNEHPPVLLPTVVHAIVGASIGGARLTVVHRRLHRIVEHLPGSHLRVEHPMIAGVELAKHRALHIRRGLRDHDASRLLRGQRLVALETIFPRFERLQHRLHRPLRGAVPEHRHHKLRPRRQQALHRTFLRNCHCQARWAKARLRHPRREHCRGGVLTPRGDDAEGAHDAAHRLLGTGAHDGGGPRCAAAPLPLLLLHRLCQVCPRLLTNLQHLHRWLELAADGVKRKRKAAILQRAVHHVDRLAAPSKGAKDAAGFGARVARLLQNGAQRLLDRRRHMAAQRGAAQHKPTAPPHQLLHLLRVRHLAVQALHPHTRLGNTPRDGLRHRGCVAVCRGVNNTHRRLLGRRDLFVRPFVVLADELGGVVADDGAVQRGELTHVARFSIRRGAVTDDITRQLLQRLLRLLRGGGECAFEVMTEILVQLLPARVVKDVGGADVAAE
mmetsp:Transcript_10195/g.18399  ORF Transcript_10195/g.18399 Transcript_10195/m.18399 type:complete len:443 (-) Transcript_10195:1105-2433(-)